MLIQTIFYWYLITFAQMKKKYSILSLVFGLMLLMAIVLQSAHSFHHIEEVLVEKKCLHKHSENKAEIIHGHHELDHCFVCEFTFSNSVTNTTFSFQFKQPMVATSYSFFHSKEITQFFRGSLFALRAPPSFIV